MRWAAVAAVALVLTAAGCARRQPPRPETPADKGRRLFAEMGCNACHSTDGTPGAGPTLKGVYGSQVRLVGGQTVTADDAYLRESILDPDAKVVEGFSPGVMAAAVSRSQVEADGNVDALVSYIKSLR